MVKKLGQWGLLGFGATLLTAWILSGISKFLTAIPGVEAQLQSVSITTTGVGDVINPGLSVYVQKLLGYIPVSISGSEWIITGIGGALFVMLGAWLALDVLKLSFKTKLGKVTSVFVLASLATTAILAMAVTIPTIPVLIALVVDALLLGLLAVVIDNLLAGKVIP